MSAVLQPGDVAAVVVTYHPALELLADVLAQAQAQSGRVVVVDNASSAATQAWLAQWQAAGPCRHVLANADNLGIATGFNQGIALARTHGQRAVLLLDQDSAIQPGMVQALADALAAAQGQGLQVAAVGPVFIDRRTGQAAPFVRIGWLLNRKLAPPVTGWVETDFLISSGSLTPLEVFDATGDMDPSLFIDNVDLEWSFRARAAGYRLLGVAGARMGHAIGDRVLSVPLPGAGLAISLHGPVRLYYMTRNRLALYRRPTTPLRWVSQDIPRMLAKFAGMSLLVAPRWRNCRAMCLGVVDALAGRLGPCRHRT